MHWEDDSNIDSTRLIDAYGHSVLQNELEAIVLSILYYRGKLSDEDILDFVKIPKPQLERTLKTLFDARFIQRKQQHFWSCSEKSVSLLETFDLGTDSAKMLLSDLGVDAANQQFLMGYLTSAYSQHLNITATEYLRSLKFYLRTFFGNAVPSKERITRMVYSLLIGSNPIVQGLKETTFVEFILKDWSHKSGIDAVHIKDNILFISQCKYAKDDFKDSNEAIFKRQFGSEMSGELLLFRLFLFFEELKADNVLLSYIDSQPTEFINLVMSTMDENLNQDKAQWRNYFVQRCHDLSFNNSVKYRGHSREVRRAEILLDAFSTVVSRLLPDSSQ